MATLKWSPSSSSSICFFLHFSTPFLAMLVALWVIKSISSVSFELKPINLFIPHTNFSSRNFYSKNLKLLRHMKVHFITNQFNNKNEIKLKLKSSMIWRWVKNKSWWTISFSGQRSEKSHPLRHLFEEPDRIEVPEIRSSLILYVSISFHKFYFRDLIQFLKQSKLILRLVLMYIFNLGKPLFV